MFHYRHAAPNSGLYASHRGQQLFCGREHVELSVPDFASQPLDLASTLERVVLPQLGQKQRLNLTTSLLQSALLPAPGGLRITPESRKRRKQGGHPLLVDRHQREHRGLPVPHLPLTQGDHRAKLANHRVRTLTIALVHDEEVTDLQDPSLGGLDPVSSAR